MSHRLPYCTVVFLSTFIQVLSLFPVKFLQQNAWACSSGVEGLPRTCEALVSSLTTAKQKKKKVREIESPSSHPATLVFFLFLLLSHSQSQNPGPPWEKKQPLKAVKWESCLVGRGEERPKGAEYLEGFFCSMSSLCRAAMPAASCEGCGAVDPRRFRVKHHYLHLAKMEYL